MAEVTLEGGNGASWASFTFSILGVPTTGVQRITYKDMQQKQNNYGAGRKPYNRTKGTIEYEGSITLFLDVVWALVKSSTTGRLQDLPPFEITCRVVYGTQSKTTILKYVEFTENGLDTSEGDMNTIVELPLIIGDIEFKDGL
jgi:hypothetical protein